MPNPKEDHPRIEPLPIGDAAKIAGDFEQFRQEMLRKICDSVYGRPLIRCRDEIGF